MFLRRDENSQRRVETCSGWRLEKRVAVSSIVERWGRRRLHSCGCGPPNAAAPDAGRVFSISKKRHLFLTVYTADTCHARSCAVPSFYPLTASIANKLPRLLCPRSCLQAGLCKSHKCRNSSGNINSLLLRLQEVRDDGV